MSYFIFPANVTDQMDKISSLLLDHSSQTRKLFCRSCKTSCKPLHSGGLLVRDMQVSNNAMLGKRTWQLLMESMQLDKEMKSLWAFHTRSSISQRKPSGRPKPNHKIKVLQEIDFYEGFAKIMDQVESKTGNMINIWCDGWVEDFFGNTTGI